MINQNYQFFKNNQWQFTVPASDIAGFTAFCTAKKDDDKINATCTIVGGTITVTFTNTDVAKGNWKYDVEANNGTDNFTFQRGVITVL